MTHIAIYGIGELTGGIYSGLLGYTGFWSGEHAIPNTKEALEKLAAAGMKSGIVAPRQSRRNPNNNSLDPLLAIVCEPKACSYILVLADDHAGATFQDNPIEPIGEFAKSHITDITLSKDRRMATFCIDPISVRESEVGQAIACLNTHKLAIRVPFLINLTDGKLKLPSGEPLPAGLIDDHRYGDQKSSSHEEHQTDDHHHGHKSIQQSDHGNREIRHGGVHPSSLSNFLVVEL